MMKQTCRRNVSSSLSKQDCDMLRMLKVSEKSAAVGVCSCVWVSLKNSSERIYWKVVIVLFVSQLFDEQYSGNIVISTTMSTKFLIVWHSIWIIVGKLDQFFSRCMSQGGQRVHRVFLFFCCPILPRVQESKGTHRVVCTCVFVWVEDCLCAALCREHVTLSLSTQVTTHRTIECAQLYQNSTVN